MKKITKPSINFWGMLLLITLLCLSFSTGGSRSQYTLPIAAWSVTAGDIYQDGDNDIVVGHNYSSQTQWSGFSILLNDGNGYFELYDSVFLYGWQPDILIQNIDTMPNYEIIAKYEDAQNEDEFITVINDFNLSDISYFCLNTYQGVDLKTIGDINGDNAYDLVVASNHGQFWGVMYNDGTGSFSDPEYHYISGSYPTDIACGDLNDDGRDDIVVCGNVVELYYSTVSGFQKYQLSEHELKANIIDIDNDGDMDIVALTDLYLIGLTGISVYENLGNNNFFEHDEIDFQPSASDFSVSDMNNDSLSDLVVTSHFPDTTGTGIADTIGGIYILYNEGNYQFSEPQFVPLENFGESIRKSCCADFDGNGYNDIATIRYLYVTIPNLDILFNDGNGNFQQNPVTGIKPYDEKTQNPIVCYPNPFTSQLSIEINTSTSQNEIIEIYDIEGKLVKDIKTGKNMP
ncbi:MAG TPA: T9SS type A sorting domain-containing protein, partial [Candidatus Marinimicrobia bacterium]|nr:T9SS type A sorting domain-containing protein [Candidatus Neomarinimicrobiota bacterium]